MTARSERTYLPAAGHDWFLPLYDPLTRILGADKARQALLTRAELRPYQRVLDLGCGTGALTVAIKQEYPSIEVFALDPDPRALARAQQKAEAVGLAVRFDQGFADALPYQDGTFDRVFSSLMFHHLDPGSRPRALTEIRRVLTPQGRLELLDFEGPESAGHGLVSRWLHSHHRLQDNSERRIVELMTNAGFSQVTKVDSKRLFFSRVGFYQATANKTRTGSDAGARI